MEWPAAEPSLAPVPEVAVEGEEAAFGDASHGLAADEWQEGDLLARVAAVPEEESNTAILPLSIEKEKEIPQ